MRLIKYLQEARKNPELNPKIGIIQELEPYKDKENYYIQYTNIKKLGINPINKFTTPHGIYAYPLKYIWSDLKSNMIPFAGDRKYIILFAASNPKLIETSDYTYIDLQEDIKKIKKYYIEYFNNDNEFNNNINAWSKQSKLKYPFSLFWIITKKLSIHMARKNHKKFMPVWNGILRKLNYKGFTDKDGNGLIHRNEPIQAIFLDKSIIKVVDLFDNKRRKYINKHNIIF